MDLEHLLSAAKSLSEQLSLLLAKKQAFELQHAATASVPERFSLEVELKRVNEQREHTDAERTQILEQLFTRLPLCVQLLQEQHGACRTTDRRIEPHEHRANQEVLTRLRGMRDELAAHGQDVKALEEAVTGLCARLSNQPASNRAVLENAKRVEELAERYVAWKKRADDLEKGLGELLRELDTQRVIDVDTALVSPTRHIVLPYPKNPAFTGRLRELRELHAAMHLEDAQLGATLVRNSPWPIFLTGLPGVGKTQLAIEYAYSHLTEFQLTLWVNAEGENLSPAMARVAREVIPASPTETDESVARRLVKHLEHGGPHLLILDNLTSAKSYQDFLPRLGQTRVLITSRRRDLSPYGTIEGCDHRLAVLPWQAAMKLLLARTSRLATNERAAAKELCRELGYLPLALAIAAQALSLTGDSPATLLQIIRELGPTAWADHAASSSHLEEEERRFIRSYPSLSKLFDATYNFIRGYCPHAEFVAQGAGFFAAAPIERQLLLDAANDIAAAVGQPVQDAERGKEALSWLIRLGLADVVVSKGVSFHWLVQDYLRHKGAAVARQAMLRALSQLVQRTYERGLTPVNLTKLALHRSHIEYADRILSPDDAQESYFITLGRVWVMTLSGEYAAVLERCAEVEAQVKDPYLAAWIAHQRGWVLLPLGRYQEALACLRRAFAMRRRLAQTTPLELCYELHDIARCQIALGHYISARRCLLSAKRCLAKVTNQHLQKLGEALVEHQLGRVAFFQGRYADAEQEYYLSLSIKRQCNSNSDALYANTLHALGELHCVTGAYEQALSDFEHALHIRRQLSPVHPDLLSTQEGIAQVYLRQGQLAAAAAAFKDVRAQREKLLGSSHPDLAACLEGYGRALFAQGAFVDSWQTLRRAYVIRVRRFGKQHASLATSYEALGECALLRGQVRRARALFTLALKVRTALQGASSPSLQGALDSLIRSWTSSAEALRLRLIEQDPQAAPIDVMTDPVFDRCQEALRLDRMLNQSFSNSPPPLQTLATAILRYRDRRELAQFVACCEKRLAEPHALVVWLRERCSKRDLHV